MITVGFDPIEFDPSLEALVFLLQVQVQEAFRRSADAEAAVLAATVAEGSSRRQARASLKADCPVLIDIPIDYSDNLKLMQNVHPACMH